MKRKAKNIALIAFHWSLYRFWLWIAGKENISQLNVNGRRKNRTLKQMMPSIRRLHLEKAGKPERPYLVYGQFIPNDELYRAYLTLAKKKQHRAKKGKW